MEKNRIFSKNLKIIRDRKRLSMAEFSAALDVPKSTIQSIMDGGNTTLYTAIHIADRLNIPLGVLLNEELSPDAVNILPVLISLFDWFAGLSITKQSAMASCLEQILAILNDES